MKKNYHRKQFKIVITGKTSSQEPPYTFLNFPPTNSSIFQINNIDMLRKRSNRFIFPYHSIHHACVLPHWQVNQFFKWIDSVLDWSVAGLQVGTWCGSSSFPSLSSCESWSGTRARHRPKRNPRNRTANAVPLRRPAIEPNPHAKESLFQAALRKFQESTVKLQNEI